MKINSYYLVPFYLSAFLYWYKLGYSELSPELIMRITIPGAALLEIGLQLVFAGLHIGTLKIGFKIDDYEKK